MDIEVVDQDTRQQNLHDRSTGKPNKFAKEGEKEVPGLVDNQICTIQQGILPPIEYKV